MKEKQKEKLATHQAVSDLLEQHRSKWQTIDAMRSQYDRFLRNLKKGLDHQQIIETDLTPLKVRKAEEKKRLIRLLFPIISVMDVFASDTGNRGLQKLTNRKLNQLEKMKPGEMLKYALSISRAADKQLGLDHSKMKKPPASHLKEYGLTGEHIKQLKLGIVSYQSAIDGFNAASLKRKQSAAKILDKASENELLLQKKLDKMMHLFRETENEFYVAYISVRTGVPEKPARSAVKTAGKESVQAKPAATKVKPAATKATPAVTKAKPAATKAKPSATKAKPAATKAKPSATKAKPSASNAKPSPVKPKPEATKAKPGPAGTAPESEELKDV